MLPLTSVLNLCEADLARLRVELEDYQRLIDELPAIYEQKFSQRLNQVVVDIQRLMQERRQLERQLLCYLPDSSGPSPRVEKVSLHGFAPFVTAVSRVARGLNTAPNRVPLRVVLVAGLITGAFAAGVRPSFLARPQAPSMPSAPVPVEADSARASADASSAQPDQSSSPSQLRLRATGEAWLIVEAPDGEVLYEGTLQKGQNSAIEWRPGLRVRSGRPDLVEFAAGDQPFRTLGNFGDYGWRTVTPASNASDSSS